MQARCHTPSHTRVPARRLQVVPVSRYTHACAAAAPSSLGAFRATAGQGCGFYTGDDGHLYCDSLRVDDVRAQHAAHLSAAGIPGPMPFYLYSASKLDANFSAYEDALDDIPHIIGYAVKANNNMAIMRRLCARGCGAVLVSGNELKLALAAGYDPTRTILNGNGKLPWELELAARHDVLINVDSEFDLGNIAAASRAAGRRVRVLLRINPDVDPEVHPYISTGMATSKFGIRNTRLEWFLDTIRGDPDLELVGLHCHLGSTIKTVAPFKDAARILCDLIRDINGAGFALKFLNFGGGLGIDYSHAGERYPTPRELIDTVRGEIKALGLTMIIEPGRSMVATAAALVCSVTGVKANGAKNFIVVDGSMSNLIRPSLYDAYQHIELTAPCQGEEITCDVVGPVCESSDFLGKDRRLPQPAAGAGLVVHDAGAYGMAMASMYNLQMPPAEYWVCDGELVQIRRPMALDDFIALFPDG